MIRTCLICECTSTGLRVRFTQRDICTDCERELARTGMVWCKTGEHVVPLSESNKARCKACDKARNKAHYQPYSRAEEARAYREKNKALLRAYYQRHDVKARRAAWQRANYKANPAHYRAVYRRHAAYKRDYSRRRYWSDPTHWRAVGRQRRFNRKLAILRAWRRA